jgi:hypothetical protein
MTHRCVRALGLIAMIALAACTAQAQECRLEGLVAADDGTPAPGVRVMLMRGRFKAQVLQITSGDDGKFSLPSIACGEYRLFVSGMTTMMTVDTRKQSSVTVAVPRAVAASSRRRREELAEPPPPPAASDEDRADERVAALYRERFVREFGAAEELDLYLKAQTAERRVQVFILAISRRLFGIVSTGPASNVRPGKRRGPNSADEETERMSQVSRADTKALVATMLSASDAATFDSDPPPEQARKAISATRLALLRMQWPSATLLFYTDATSGAAIKTILRAAFGADNGEVREWDTRGNPRWRGQLLQRALIELCYQGLAFIEQGTVTPGLQTLFDETARSAADSFAGAPTEEKEMIGGAFGRAVRDGYERLAPPRRQHLFRLAVLSSLLRIYDPPESIDRK